jgi:hypothetical protein
LCKKALLQIKKEKTEVNDVFNPAGLYPITHKNKCYKYLIHLNCVQPVSDERVVQKKTHMLWQNNKPSGSHNNKEIHSL